MAKIVILGPIDFLFGLPINLNVNAWQSKFVADVFKNVAKLAKSRPKIACFFEAKSNGVKIKALFFLV